MQAIMNYVRVYKVMMHKHVWIILSLFLTMDPKQLARSSFCPYLLHTMLDCETK